jgi:hypothetical protein
MRITSAGLKSSHPTSRFSRSPNTRRERQLGLKITAATRMTTHPGSHARVPLLASLRQAARSSSSAESATRATAPKTTAASRLAPAISFTWSRPAGSGSRRPRPRSAAPWRG